MLDDESCQTSSQRWQISAKEKQFTIEQSTLVKFYSAAFRETRNPNPVLINTGRVMREGPICKYVGHKVKRKKRLNKFG